MNNWKFKLFSLKNDYSIPFLSTLIGFQRLTIFIKIFLTFFNYYKVKNNIPKNTGSYVILGSFLFKIEPE